jgi:hypothetical protein
MLMAASQVEVVHDLDAAFFKLEEYDAIVNEDEHSLKARSLARSYAPRSVGSGSALLLACS